MRLLPTSVLMLSIAGAGTGQPQSEAPSEPAEASTPPTTRTLFPHLRINTQERWLEIDGIVPITVDDPDAPTVYLEQVVCGRESPEIAAGKEHESLVATNAKGSHIHAGLLLLGLEPGRPVRWSTEEDGSIKAHEPEGPPIRVEFIWTDADGIERTATPQDWIRHESTGERFPDGCWVFAGSLFVDFGAGEVYDADRSGTLVGLASFGTEVLSWNTPIHHEAGINLPVWTANNDTVPEFKTPVKVRLYVVDQQADRPTNDDAQPPAEPEQESPG